jgi:hypothetical protein
MKRRSFSSSAARLGLPLVFVVGAIMVIWTWGTWPDPLVDFGRELYVPWQLWQGRVLYRDIAHFNGPLSAYFNALLYLIFGVSLRSLVIGNLAIAVCMAVMIHSLFRRAGGERFSATICGLVFAMLFLSLQLVDIGNYNWITPYSHELTHGVALSFASLLMLALYLAKPRAVWIAACGFALGCVFLTKIEVFATAAPSVVIGFLLSTRTRRLRREKALRHLALFVVALLAPPAIAIALLSLAMPVRDAIRGTFSAWTFALDRRITDLAFYRRSMGTDAPVANAIIGLKQAGAYALALAPAAVIGQFVRRRFRWLLPLMYAIALVVVLVLLESPVPFAGLSVVALLIVALLLIVVARSRFHSRPRVLLRFVLATFGLLLLGKIFLAARVYHYGFALAMPAMLVAVAAFTSWLPRWIEKRNGNGHILRAAALALVGIVLYVHLRAYAMLYHDKPVIVAQGTADQFRANGVGVIVNEVSHLLGALPPGTTVAVVPQGVMIDYLSARNNPTPYVTLMPPEVLMYDDATIFSAYERNRPDVVVIIGADLSEYGYASFDEVAPLTAAFFREHYTPVRTLTLPDLPPATILRRTTAPPPQTPPGG